jgi:hypothetical protein
MRWGIDGGNDDGDDDGDDGSGGGVYMGTGIGALLSLDVSTPTKTNTHTYTYTQNRGTWNLPVHHFCRLHIMPVCKAAGFPIQLSCAAVFFLSALVHELPMMVSWYCRWALMTAITSSNPILPLAHTRTHITPPPPPQPKQSKQLMFRTWGVYGPVGCLFGPAFQAMMVQLPLVGITIVAVPKSQAGEVVGNLLFWLVFCGLIQPLVVSCWLGCVCAYVFYGGGWLRRGRCAWRPIDWIDPLIIYSYNAQTQMQVYLRDLLLAA